MIHYPALRGKITLRLAANVLVTLALLSASLWGTTGVSANHPVYVEGNCLVPPAGASTVPAPGT
jgi:hypothetical protein